MGRLRGLKWSLLEQSERLLSTKPRTWMRQSRSRKRPRDAAAERIATGAASDVIDDTTTAMLPASACAAVSSATVFLLSPLWPGVLLLQGDMPSGLLPRQQLLRKQLLQQLLS